MARILTLKGEVLAEQDQNTEARTAWDQALSLLLDTDSGAVPFGRLHTLVRVMHLAELEDQATAHKQQLHRAGFVPLRPYP